MPSFLKATDDGVYLSVKVQPRAAKNKVGDAAGDELKVWVTAPPVDSAANDALLRLLAEKLDCPLGAVQLVRGQTSRHKQVRVTGLSAADVTAKLT